MHVIYLHGFLSSPQAGKAQYFQKEFKDRGISFAVPDLNGDDFYRSTADSMMEIVGSEIHDGEENVLIGSSMGGTLALYFAEKDERVKKLILMAPAFELGSRMRQELGEEALAWEKNGFHNFFHYAYEKELPLSYDFLSSFLKLEKTPLQRQMPALTFQGLNDTVVPPEIVIPYPQKNPEAEIVLFASDHQLSDKKEAMLSHMERFLGMI